MPASQCPEDGCAFIHFESDVQVHQMEIPLIVTVQNGREYYSTSIDIDNILKYGDIPALDFSQDPNEFCAYTQNEAIAVIAAGGSPNRWQRITNTVRIASISAWINGPGNQSMPDGILLGERHEDVVEIDVNNVNVIGGRTIYTATLTNTLNPDCPVCGNFGVDAAGNQIYRSRCFNHACPSHDVSTSPLNIIDGQHRVMGLFESAAGVVGKDVACCLLVHNPANNIGFPLLEQAKVFTRVNSESKDLTSLHKLWLKRIFTDWSPAAYASEAKTAFDLMIRLGMRGGASPWNTAGGAIGTVKAHPRRNLRFRIDTVSGSDAGAAGKILGTSSMEMNIPILEADSVAFGIAHDVMMDNWLRSSVAQLPAMFAYPGGVSVFDRNRCFEAWLRVYHFVREYAETLPTWTGTFATADFDPAIVVHAGEFAAANLTEWERFDTGGEPPKKHLYNVLRVMWTPNAAGTLDVAPTVSTHLIGGPGGLPPANWAEYIGLSPDPIVDFSVVTLLINGYQPAGTSLDLANPRANWGNPGDIATWNRPINTGYSARIQYRWDGPGGMGNWVDWAGRDGSEANEVICHPTNDCEIQSNNETFPSIQGLPAGTDWDLRITYRGDIGNGDSEIVIGFVL